MAELDLKKYIRDIPDFPEPGILFRDITPLLACPEAFDGTISGLVDLCGNTDFDVIVAVESRGFIFAAPMAREMNRPLVPVRKAGKLPSDTHSVEYDLEYGSNILEIHADGVKPGDRALVVDDLLAIGGTLSAAANLVEACGGVVALLAVVIELEFLNGRSQLKGRDLVSLVKY